MRSGHFRGVPSSLSLCALGMLAVSSVGGTWAAIETLRNRELTQGQSAESETLARDPHFQRIQLTPVLLSDSVEASHNFRFQNDSDRTLALKDPFAGCGCARVSLDTRELVPAGYATLSVAVNLSKGLEGLKTVSNSVVAESGERWRFDLAIPVVSRLVVPSRLVLRPHDLSADVATASAEFDVTVRAPHESRFPEQIPEGFFSSSQSFSLNVIGQSDGSVESADQRFASRVYQMKLDLAPADHVSRQTTIEWHFEDASATTFVDIIAPPLATLTPSRVIVSHREENAVKLRLDFHRDDVIARLVRCPDFLSLPDGQDRFSSDRYDVTLIANPDRATRAVDEIVFELSKNEKVLAEVKTTIVVVPILNSRQEGETP